MNSEELTLAAIKGEKIPRFPVIPYISQFATVYQDVNYTKFAKDGDLIADVLRKTRETFDYDGVYISTDSAIEVEAMGLCEVRFFENDVPTVGTFPLEDDDKWKNFDMQDREPLDHGRIKEYVKAIKKVRNESKTPPCIIAGTDGPVTIAGHLRNLNKIMIDFIEDPDSVHRVFEKIARFTVKQARTYIEAGATIVHFGDPPAVMLGNDRFREFCLPYYKRVADAIHDAGGLISLHICGDTTPIREAMLEAGTDVMDVDADVALSFARDSVHDRCTLKGNIDTINVMRLGDPKKVKTAVTEAMDTMRGTSRYIVSSGCHIPAETPPEAVKLMVETAKAYSLN